MRCGKPGECLLCWCGVDCVECEMIMEKAFLLDKERMY